MIQTNHHLSARPVDSNVKIEEIVEAEVKLEIAEEDAVKFEYLDVTWPPLDPLPLKFEPEPPVDLRQELDFSNKEDAFIRAQVSGIRIALATLSNQSVNVELPLTTLGLAAAPEQRGRPNG